MHLLLILLATIVLLFGIYQLYKPDQYALYVKKSMQASEAYWGPLIHEDVQPRVTKSRRYLCTDAIGGRGYNTLKHLDRLGASA